MKKLLYILTMLFNALGSLCTMSLFAFAGSFCFQNLFLILIGSVVFVTSFTITILDYNNIYKPTRTVKTAMEVKPKDEVVINDYKDYFVQKKLDFTIC